MSGTPDLTRPRIYCNLLKVYFQLNFLSESGFRFMAPPSIDTVAKQAGVSVATVSRVLNASGPVSSKSRNVVLKAASDLGYLPLRRHRRRKDSSAGMLTKSICLVAACETGRNMFHLPVLPSLLTGIERQAELEGINLMVATVTGEQYPRVLDADSCDGVLFVGTKISPATAQMLSSRLKSCLGVWLMRQGNEIDLPFDRIFYNNDAVGQIAGEYLAGGGHRHVAIIDPQPYHSAHDARLEGLRQVCKQRGMHLSVCYPSHIVSTPQVTYEQTKAAVQTYLELKERPTGLFVPRDQLTQHVVSCLEAAGVQVGIDVDLISCDNDPKLSSWMPRRPPSIDIHLEEIGAAGVRRLVQRIADPRAPQFQTSVTPSLAIPKAWPAWRNGRRIEGVQT
ncbi:MAG: LacI family DNA-binding transcriptional regulator [Planctomycetota bacterium]